MSKACKTFKKRFLALQPDFRRRYESERDQDALWANGLMWRWLLASTTLADKANMIAKCKLTLGIGRDKLERIFARAARLKDCCSNPTGMEGSKHPLVHEPEIDRRKFGAFIRDCREMIEALVSFTPWISPFSPRYNQ
jgi:hypothetical protein